MTKEKKKEMICLSAIGFVFIVFIWFLFVHIPTAMSESYANLEKLVPAKTQVTATEPSYCVVSGSFLSPIMLVSGENTICQTPTTEKLTVHITKADVVSENDNGDMHYYCRLYTDKGEKNVHVGFYSSNAEAICDFFKEEKNYHLYAKRSEYDNELTPIQVRKEKDN